jgi:hypothetical protein
MSASQLPADAEQQARAQDLDHHDRVKHRDVGDSLPSTISSGEVGSARVTSEVPAVLPGTLDTQVGEDVTLPYLVDAHPFVAAAGSEHGLANTIADDPLWGADALGAIAAAETERGAVKAALEVIASIVSLELGLPNLARVAVHIGIAPLAAIPWIEKILEARPN